MPRCAERTPTASKSPTQCHPARTDHTKLTRHSSGTLRLFELPGRRIRQRNERGVGRRKVLEEVCVRLAVRQTATGVVWHAADSSTIAGKRPEGAHAIHALLYAATFMGAP